MLEMLLGSGWHGGPSRVSRAKLAWIGVVF